MEKQTLIFRMRNAETNVDIIATHKFLKQWMDKGFAVIGYKIQEYDEEIFDWAVNDIPENLV